MQQSDYQPEPDWTDLVDYSLMQEAEDTEQQQLERMSDEELEDAMHNHDCKVREHSFCFTCYEYMKRHNPKQLVQIGWEEDNRVDERD